MSPRGPGGRPRKDWTPRRHRNLVRLFTLTTLGTDEILRVLEEGDFRPKESNTRLQLKTLLQEQYRSFRPKNEAEMIARIDSFRKMNHGRITKSQRYGKSKDAMNLKSALARRSLTQEVPQFLDYSDSSTRSFTYTASPAGDSIPTNSSLLMLDGSMVTSVSVSAPSPSSKVSQKPESSGKYAMEQEGTSNADLSRLKSFHNTSEDPEAMLMTYTSQAEFRPEPGLNDLTTRLNQRSPSISKRILSLISQKTMSSRRSSLSLKSHFSIRSSWMSVKTAASKVSDVLSAPKSTLLFPVPTSHSQSLTTDTQSKKLPKQREVWHEVVDESDLDFAPEYAKDALHHTKNRIQQRTCCNGEKLWDINWCRECGCTKSIAKAETDGFPTYVYEILHTDFYGNTMLHYVACSVEIIQKLAVLESLINLGADVCAKNSCGETFMHIFDHEPYTRRLALSSDYTHFLKKLDESNFPFYDLDCHGRSSMDVICSTFSSSSDKKALRRKVQNELGPQQSTKVIESGGAAALNSVEELSRDTPAANLPWYNISRRAVQPSQPDFRHNFREALLSNDYDPPLWMALLEEFSCMQRIDIRGDTPLTSILKAWYDVEDASLISAVHDFAVKYNVPLEMKDPKGRTALAIASIRGYVSVVRVLLDSGANPNSRTYHGRGIIALSNERMDLAKKKGNTRTYASLLTCIHMLIDAGAEIQPTGRDEWVLPQFV